MSKQPEALPEPYTHLPFRDGVEPLFTSDQMQAYAAAEAAKERERCAEIVDGFAMLAFGVAESSFKQCAAELRMSGPSAAHPSNPPISASKPASGS